LFIRAMHNRVGPRVASREIGPRELIPLAPLVVAILVLAFYPQFFLRRSEPSVRATVAAVAPPGLPSGATAYAPLRGTP
jgi:NADH-quinone oxidoreductase subunit M